MSSRKFRLDTRESIRLVLTGARIDERATIRCRRAIGHAACIPVVRRNTFIARSLIVVCSMGSPRFDPDSDDEERFGINDDEDDDDDDEAPNIAHALGTCPAAL